MQYSAAIYPTENEKTALAAGKKIRNFRRCCKEGPKPRMAMGSELLRRTQVASPTPKVPDKTWKKSQVWLGFKTNPNSSMFSCTKSERDFQQEQHL